MKIAVITCYAQNDYVRAVSLRAAFSQVPGVEVKIIRNSRKGFLRYIEVACKVLAARLFSHIDAYVVTFRGYEILPVTLLVKGRKPLVFDEFVNAVEFLRENQWIKPNGLLIRAFIPWYGWLLKKCRFILADTPMHAEYSSQVNRLPIGNYRVIPMAADEMLFRPAATQRGTKRPFTVFYYGKEMRPLQGLEYILEAAVLLKDRPEIVFQIVGGHHETAKACATAVAKGACISYEPWVDFEEFPKHIQAADLMLGGPFGKTLQSQFVVPGKTTQFLASAKPVLIARNLAQADFIDRQNCLSVPPADPEAIAEAIKWAIGHPAELQKIGEAGRKLYDQKFSQKIVNRIVSQIVKGLA